MEVVHSSECPLSEVPLYTLCLGPVGGLEMVVSRVLWRGVEVVVGGFPDSRGWEQPTFGVDEVKPIP